MLSLRREAYLHTQNMKLLGKRLRHDLEEASVSETNLVWRVMSK